ncbi:MAG: DNA-binding protein [Desulfobacterales bacterium]|nr:DNA-binding protein [Deltaproteobacteria bacterium]NIR15654.1 DNA-binding protein [Desulfobacterales bacterium]
MKGLKIIGMLVVFTLTNSIAFSEADAQEQKYWRDSVGQGYRGEYQGKYDPKTITTVKGVVETVEQMPPATGTSYGIHLELRTDSGTLSVHLGPAWFIDRQDIKIGESDTIQVKGSKITYEGKPTIIAAEVKKENTVLKLRDQNGFPVWAGRR